ncbi:MAG: hypothetical protein JWO38_1182 [Gemmataceae bacterium]|nr:hypothetical protein [Gemmataceae bacterium]
MPITAICPYCSAGGVRAPDRAVGLSATCPKCGSNFTIIPSADPPQPAGRSSPAVPPSSPVGETRAHAVAGDVTEPSPILPPESRPSVRPVAPVQLPPSPASPALGGFAVALVGVILFGFAMLAAQVPHGRMIGIGLGGLGLVIGLGCLAAEGRTRLVGAGAALLNLVAVGLLLFAPVWLGLAPWRGTAPAEGLKGPHAVGHGTGISAPAEWVDAENASWEVDDVRVSVRSAVLGPVELIGPNGQKRRTREDYLQLTIRVANEGARRRIELTGWAAGRRVEGLRLTDAAGTELKPKTFEAEWGLWSGPSSDGLFPSKSVLVLLVFDPPAGRVGPLHLTLPGAAVGVDQPVRFQIPRSIVTRQRTP